MEIVLLERVEKLGQMGDVVKVKDGYARNYLLPKKKALRATSANMTRFETEKAQLEARSLEQKKEAESVASKMDGQTVVLLRQASESAQLYGSVNARDIATAVTEAGFSLNRSQVMLDRAIKVLGVHPVRVTLHPEVEVRVSVNVARSEAEAESQAAKFATGLETVAEAETVITEAESPSEETEAPAIEEFFEEPQQVDESDETPEKSADSTE